MCTSPRRAAEAPSRSEKACAAERATKSLPPPMAVVTMRSGRWNGAGPRLARRRTATGQAGRRSGRRDEDRDARRKRAARLSRRRHSSQGRKIIGGTWWSPSLPVSQRPEPEASAAPLPSAAPIKEGRLRRETMGAERSGSLSFRRAARPEPKASAAPFRAPPPYGLGASTSIASLHCLDGFAFR